MTSDAGEPLDGATAESLAMLAERFGLDDARLGELLGVSDVTDPAVWDTEARVRLEQVLGLCDFLYQRLDDDGCRAVIDAPAPAFAEGSLFAALAAGQVERARAVYEAAFGLRPPPQQ